MDLIGIMCPESTKDSPLYSMGWVVVGGECSSIRQQRSHNWLYGFDLCAIKLNIIINKQYHERQELIKTSSRKVGLVIYLFFLNHPKL